jgi:tRNA(fMet)-specific endonuclease VapC
MHCLDTNVVIAIFRGVESDLRAKLENLKLQGVRFAITTVTLSELYRGAFLSASREQNIAQINEFLEGLVLIGEDKQSCLLFGQDFAFLQKKGMQTQELDLIIASICKSNHLVLVTKNIKDFRNIPNLLIESW